MHKYNILKIYNFKKNIMYKIVWQWFAWINHQKVVQITFDKSFLFISSKIKWDRKVYFDLYDKKRDQQVFIWFANIEKDWIELWYKDRNKIIRLIQNHFKTDYIIWNWRNTLKKV